MPVNGYFYTPFADSGIKTTVPDAVQPDGSVSYSAGYGIYYTQDPAIDPLTALNIEEDKFNQVLYDATYAIQQLQQFGVPEFITSAMNGGSSFNYTKGALVKKSGIVYQSLAATTSTPPGADWQVFDLGLFALLASPTFTGTPAAPTAASGTSTTQIATTAFANPAVSAAANGYVKLPSGIIIQWWFFSPGASVAGVTNVLPIAFPNHHWTSVATLALAKGSSPVAAVGLNPVSLTQVDCTSTSTIGIYGISIGN